MAPKPANNHHISFAIIINTNQKKSLFRQTSNRRQQQGMCDHGALIKGAPIPRYYHPLLDSVDWNVLPHSQPGAQRPTDTIQHQRVAVEAYLRCTPPSRHKAIPASRL
jgi:hypothetical protein